MTSISFQAGDSGFQFEGHYIRLVRDFTTEAGTVEEIGFVATDLAKALEMREAERITRLLDSDQKGPHLVGTPGGTQSLTVISESGFYDVVVRSDKAQGKKLRAVVTREILPAIRQTGRYVAQPARPAAPMGLKDTVETLLLICDRIQQIPGVKPGIAMAQALTTIGMSTDLIVEPFRLALPPAQDPLCSLNATALGEQIGKSAKATNQCLVGCGLQVRNARGDWELTENGKQWAEALPFNKNGHSGYQILWNPAVIGVLREAEMLD